MDLSALGSGAPGGRRELREAGRGLGELATRRQATEGFRSKASRMEGASSFSEGAGYSVNIYAGLTVYLDTVSGMNSNVQDCPHIQELKHLLREAEPR